MKSRKVVIIGLDGADWRVIQPAISNGLMPVLAKLQAEGSCGSLQSTIRPESSIAWSTFATGVNPGKHGVFGFVSHKPQSYDFTLADGRNIGVRRFWDYLCAAGKRVGLINIPFTYPPNPVNGFMVCGMLTPDLQSSFTYPPQLQDKLMNYFQRLMIDAGGVDQDLESIANRVTSYTSQQEQMAIRLMQDEAWDFLAIAFTGLDRLQHFLWGEPAHYKHLQQLDSVLGRIIRQMPSETVVLTISDHGFNGVGNRIHINRWLQQMGYLRVKQSQLMISGLEKSLLKLKSIPFIQQVKRKLVPVEWGPSRLKTAVFSQSIDWSQTTAYYSPDGGIRINLEGREPEGIVSSDEYDNLRYSLIEALRNIRDPRNGCSPIANIYTREQLYSGPFTYQAPDLIVEPVREEEVTDRNYLIDSKVDTQKTVFQTSHPYKGNHAPHGILIVWGEGVEAGRILTNCQLQDIAPTVLALLESPVPDTLDGRVLVEPFTPEQRPTSTYTSTPEGELPSRQQSEMDEDITAVAKRLRNLGYLD